jgi:hypothetical protein
MKTFFNFLNDNELTPNGLYLLSVLDKINHREISLTGINYQHELNKLELVGYVVKKQKEGTTTYDMTMTGNKLLKDANKFFAPAKRESVIDTSDWDTRIKEFMELFPKGRKESTSLTFRSNPKELTERFKWFFKTYPDYNWEHVMNATKLYVDSFKDTDYTYMQTSKYFVCKRDKNQMWLSTLADICYNVATNNMQQLDSGYHYFGK